MDYQNGLKDKFLVTGDRSQSKPDYADPQTDLSIRSSHTSPSQM